MPNDQRPMRLIALEACNECPHVFWEDNDLKLLPEKEEVWAECAHPNVVGLEDIKIPDEIDRPPSWCPLPPVED